jgi:hypothetical protein
MLNDLVLNAPTEKPAQLMMGNPYRNGIRDQFANLDYVGKKRREFLREKKLSTVEDLLVWQKEFTEREESVISSCLHGPNKHLTIMTKAMKGRLPHGVDRIDTPYRVIF